LTIAESYNETKKLNSQTVISLINVSTLLSKEKQVTEEPESKETEAKACYVCGVELKPQMDNKINKKSTYADSVDNSKDIPQKYPEMTLWDGRKEIVCPDCYKSYKTGVETYYQNLKNKR